ncbi:MAG: lysophospholipid acyltransferase family protein [Gammaproteobacteria bacterium]
MSAAQDPPKPSGDSRQRNDYSRAERFRLTLRAGLFWWGMLLSTLLIAPLSLLTFPLPFHWRYRFIGQWARFNLWWLKKTCGLSYQIQGGAHIPARNAIIMAKHQSAWETLALQRIFGPQVWVLKRELLWVPLFGWGLAMLEPIAIDRQAGRKAVRQVVEQGTQRLNAGRWVVIFPEGTRVAPGERKRYGIGGALLAEHSGYPVIPVAHNAGEYWSRRSFIKRPGVIRVVIGPPIQSHDRRAADIIADVEQWIESTMTDITTLDTKRGF